MKKTRMILTMALSLILVLAMGMPAFAGSSLTAKEAASKAIKDSGVARSNVSRLETEREKGRFEVEFKNKQTRDWYEYEVGASSGRILEKAKSLADTCLPGLAGSVKAGPIVLEMDRRAGNTARP